MMIRFLSRPRRSPSPIPAAASGRRRQRSMIAVTLMALAGTAAISMKPAVDNGRVTVWDVPPSEGPPTPTGDSVWVTVSPPDATFHSRGVAVGRPPAGAHVVVIDLKDSSLAPLPNTSGYPLAFPRPGAKKLFENDRVILWDYTWRSGTPTPMHFHDKDVVVVYVEEGSLKSTTPDGQSTTNEFLEGAIRFNARNRVHTELLTSTRARAIITELK